ncbi:cytochrome-c oxidase, cbb3-type subunit III [uncultured Helicobacter sp.]|uniref:cytochrome-c oxidase, cbb3-type subunit III n=1 Tax=Helicobacter sp. TaxID=218 RepID=UPI002A7C5176|nr:cytochrome-c oxidase, cbb3-type subunit III [Helicobacter sp.]MCI7710098.1 cytochrome-c oxidase, cbb3-type subunit III [Helicobacter sp.]MDD7346076.1 cytochrome-c oxidase, cbb3-type subunit III [Helicobacter sp.]MDY2823245.1 cytochrome-c oxidase, cbb3-type subunit III [Helicobacter sp.]
MQWFDLSDSVNALALLGAIVILILTVFIMGLYLKKIKDAKQSDGEQLDHNWDGIGEFANNIPVGWVACFGAVILWGFWYFFLGYPLKSFSQIGEYNKEVQKYNAAYAEKWEGLDATQLKDMGLNIFQVQCAQCHGPEADGMDGKAQNLINWGKEEGVIDVIKHGSKGLGYLMDEMAPVDVNDDEARAIAAYVMKELSAKKETKYPLEVEKGKELFEVNCAACHGDDGKGMEGTALDLTTYGSTSLLHKVLNHGKRGNIGIMPSFGYANFAPAQEEALNAYIQSLSIQE